MKRDFELIRKLLFFFEAREKSEYIESPDINGNESTCIKYHCRLLYDAGFLRCEPITSSTSDRVIRVLGFELTWDGHEFLEKIRTDTMWKKINDYAFDKGIPLSFSVVSGVAQHWIKTELFTNT